jgi:hypothetical protein
MIELSTASSKQRLKSKLGALSRTGMSAVENAVLMQIGIRR